MTLLIATFYLIIFSLIFWLLLAAMVLRYSTHISCEQLNSLLPQTQCGECGYPGCAPYAAAIHAGENINKCLPGGSYTIQALSIMTQRAVIPLDGTAIAARVAFIREPECIGCTKCIQACPVDAILGAAKQMHTVITAECTGCDLCIDSCPVDCIEMHPTSLVFNKSLAQKRFEDRNTRMFQEQESKNLQQKNFTSNIDADAEKAALIAAAIARSTAKKNNLHDNDTKDNGSA